MPPLTLLRRSSPGSRAPPRGAGPRGHRRAHPSGRAGRADGAGGRSSGLLPQGRETAAPARRGGAAGEGGGQMIEPTKLTLGEVSLTRVIEIGRSSFSTTSMLPESTAEGVARHHAWLKPDFWDDATDDLGSRLRALIRGTPPHLVLIDTGVGNDKARESNPIWHRRQGTFLEDLPAARRTPEHVDYVV